MGSLEIREIIEKIYRKYQTRNPFEIAQCLNIPVFYEELGTINGYYNKPYRQHQLLTCAHELGHALLHPNANTPFLRNNTLLSVDKMEIEANTFAAELLITDDMISENKEMTISQLSRMLGYNERFIMLKLGM